MKKFLVLFAFLIPVACMAGDTTEVFNWNQYVKDAADKRGEQLDSLYQKALDTELTDAEAIVDYIRKSGLEDEVIEKLVGEVKNQFVPSWWMIILIILVMIAGGYGGYKFTTGYLNSFKTKS